MCGSLGQRRKTGPYQVGPGSSLVASSGPSCWATAVGLRPPRRSVRRTQGKQHHREQPGHYHGGSDRGAQYAQLHPDPRGGDDERQRGRLQQGGCQGAPLTYHRPVQGGRNPAGEQCSHVELHSAGYEEEWDKDVGVAPVCTRSRSSFKPSATTEKTLRSSLAAFVTNRYWPSLVKVTDPCDWRWGVPSPSPPVATLPMRSSEPSSALRNAISSLGAALVCT